MASLVSPGVSVTVTDQSLSATPTPTTIPLIVFATRANKLTPDGSGTAIGTVEANRLRLVTSQRDLLQAYGNPVFVTSAGAPVPDSETNEFGLLAAHSYLGLGNVAYLIRADVDLGGLTATVQEPVLPPPDGTYWIRKSAVIGGIFKYNGSVWNAVPFHVYTVAPTGSDGSEGDWCFDYSDLDGTIKYKDGGTWKAATSANLIASFGASCNLFVQPTGPAGMQSGDFWYKTTSSSGGTNLQLTRYRAVDGVFVRTPIIRQPTMPTPNQNTIWEDTSQIANSGARPLFIGTGATFIQLPVFVQDAEPVTDPENGTLWFDDTITDFALYVEGTDFGRGNQWVPVQTVTVSNPTGTQKVISGSAPQFPQEGAIWVDLSTPEAIDNFPVIKRYTTGSWVDITASVKITDQDPVASAVVNGTFWLNLGESITRNTVKSFNSVYTPKTVVLDTNSSSATYNQYIVVDQTGNHWEPASGAVFGRKAQRAVVVTALQEAFVRNIDARSEANYFQLIACPGYPELYDEMLELNVDNGEVSFIVADTPKWMIPSGIPTGREVTLAEWVSNANNVAVTGEQGFASSASPYAGFWYPWCETTDVNGNNVFAPPSHMMLRVMAYSDSVAAPWFPPAGLYRGQVTNATSVGYLNNDSEYTPVTLIRSQRDVAYQNRINPITFLPNRGLTVYGQKSFSAVSSALDRVNVARLVAKMKYDLSVLLQPFLFELNDATTQRSAQNITERYLSGLKSLRALYDYAVECDSGNNTPAVIDANQLIVAVAIQPEKSIEFIYVPITIVNTGEQFPF